MIRGFKNKLTQEIFDGEDPREFGKNITKPARRKLRLIHYATALSDLSIPPGNRLELLHGNRKGQHSIRINDQDRICFVWTEAGPYEVEIVDYH